MRVRSSVSRLVAIVALVVGVAAAAHFVTAKPRDQPPTADTRRESVTQVLSDLERWDAGTEQTRRAAAEAVATRATDFEFLRLETFACRGQSHEMSVFRHRPTGMQFVLVPAGTFTMGSPPSEPDRDRDEVQHVVALTEPFLMARTPVTQKVWIPLMKRRKWSGSATDLPVDYASWSEAKEFCEKAGLELPTEAQWEWACRAGSTTAWYFGDDPREVSSFLALDDDPPASGPIGGPGDCGPVGRRRPNAFGLHDMQGFVPQWCADWYGEYEGDATDPRGPAEGNDRVTRGGLREMPPSYQRSARRGWSPGREGFAGYAVRPIRTLSR